MSEEALAPPPDIVTRVEALFEEFGWPYEKVGPQTLRTYLAGSQSHFGALVHATEHWIIATINPFFAAPQGGFGPVALRYLARANHAAHLAKVGIDSANDAFVTVELPVEGFADVHLHDAVGALAHYANVFFVPLAQAVSIDKLNRGTA